MLKRLQEIIKEVATSKKQIQTIFNFTKMTTSDIKFYLDPKYDAVRKSVIGALFDPDSLTQTEEEFTKSNKYDKRSAMPKNIDAFIFVAILTTVPEEADKPEEVDFFVNRIQVPVVRKFNGYLVAKHNVEAKEDKFATEFIEIMSKYDDISMIQAMINYRDGIITVNNDDSTVETIIIDTETSKDNSENKTSDVILLGDVGTEKKDDTKKESQSEVKKEESKTDESKKDDKTKEDSKEEKKENVDSKTDDKAKEESKTEEKKDDKKEESKSSTSDKDNIFKRAWKWTSETVVDAFDFIVDSIDSLFRTKPGLGTPVNYDEAIPKALEIIREQMLKGEREVTILNYLVFSNINMFVNPICNRLVRDGHDDIEKHFDKFFETNPKQYKLVWDFLAEVSKHYNVKFSDLTEDLKIVRYPGYGILKKADMEKKGA
jgi:hypothetical protein